MQSKVQLTLFSILVFLALGQLRLYELTDAYIADPLGLQFMDYDGYPTKVGIVAHALVAGLLTSLYLLTFRF